MLSFLRSSTQLFSSEHNMTSLTTESDEIEEIIRKYVGRSETHHAQTEDGYILKFFRIPRKNPKDVILLQHPMLFDARIWLSPYDNSIAFFFWRAGYDVWLGNTRGNRYCRKHVMLKTSDREFWNSGSTNGLVYATTRREVCENSVKMMVLVAPVSHLCRGASVTRYIVPSLVTILHFFKVDVRTSICSSDTCYVKLIKFLSKHCPALVTYFLSLNVGFSNEKTIPDFFNATTKVIGAGISLKIWVHYVQIFSAGGRFALYDYGEQENLKIYGVKKPPLYPIKKIKVPTLLLYGENDTLHCPADQEVLYSELCKSLTVHRQIKVKGFNHLDFILHSDRKQKVYRKILQILES